MTVVMNKEEYNRWNDPNYCLNAVREDDLKLQFVHNQTEDTCLEAVKQYGPALQYVHEQTRDICFGAGVLRILFI
jgi:hypothetical protein